MVEGSLCTSLKSAPSNSFLERVAEINFDDLERWPGQCGELYQNADFGSDESGDSVECRCRVKRGELGAGDTAGQPCRLR